MKSKLFIFISGLRDVDPNEWKYIHQFSIPSYPMQTIDRFSFQNLLVVLLADYMSIVPFVATNLKGRFVAFSQ